LNRSHFRPSAIARVEPDEAVIVGPIEAVIAMPARHSSRGGPDTDDLAALAAQAGYADQAHLTRECRALAGLTPAALARQRALDRD
jgi:AraC-like DNA-binding protein